MVTERDIEREIGIRESSKFMHDGEIEWCLFICLSISICPSVHLQYQSMLYAKTKICHTNAIIGRHTAIISTMSIIALAFAFAYAYSICIYKSIKKVQKQMQIIAKRIWLLYSWIVSVSICFSPSRVCSKGDDRGMHWGEGQLLHLIFFLTSVSLSLLHTQLQVSYAAGNWTLLIPFKSTHMHGKREKNRQIQKSFWTEIQEQIL